MFHSSSSDRQISPPSYVSSSKEIINGTTLIPGFPSANFSPPNILQATRRFGQPSPPPFLPLNQSLPPNYFSLHHHHQLRQPPLPPILPLPVSKPLTSSLSCPLTANTKTRSDPPFTRKKSKKKPKNPGKGETLKPNNTKVSSTSNNPLLDLPKHHQIPNNDISRNISITRSVSCVKDDIEEQYDVVGIDKFSAGRDRATFTLSPPPSSLPLPTFSLRPKLRRAAPAAGIQQRN